MSQLLLMYCINKCVYLRSITMRTNSLQHHRILYFFIKRQSSKYCDLHIKTANQRISKYREDRFHKRHDCTFTLHLINTFMNCGILFLCKQTQSLGKQIRKQNIAYLTQILYCIFSFQKKLNAVLSTLLFVKSQCKTWMPATWHLYVVMFLQELKGMNDGTPGNLKSFSKLWNSWELFSLTENPKADCFFNIIIDPLMQTHFFFHPIILLNAYSSLSYHTIYLATNAFMKKSAV